MTDTSGLLRDLGARMIKRKLFGYTLEITRGPFAVEVRFRKTDHFGVFVLPNSGYYYSKLITKARKTGKKT